MRKWEEVEGVEGSTLAKVDDAEPIFILRAQDMLAPAVIQEWARLATFHGVPAAKIKEALALATKMEAWPKRKIPT